MTHPSPTPSTGTLTARSGFILAGILLVAANLRAGITSVGPVLENIRTDLGLTAAVASVLVSIPLIAFAVVSPIAPWIAARYGMERALGGSLAVLAAAIVIRSLPLPGMIWIGTALLGISIAVLNVVLPSLIKRDFPTRVGSITGLYSVVQGTAAAVASGLAVPIAGMAHEGWRLAIGIWAGLALIALAIFWPQLRSRTLPDAEDLPSAHTASTGYRSPWSSALAWQVTAFMGLQSTLFYVAVSWLPSIEKTAGIDAATAGFHQFELQMMGVVANFVTAIIIQRTRRQSLLAAVAALIGLAGVLGMLWAPGLAVIWVAFIGYACGSSIVIALSLFGLRTINHAQAASLSGMAQAVGYTLAAAGPIAIGLIHDATGGWEIPLLVIAGLVVIQGIFGALAGREKQIIHAA